MHKGTKNSQPISVSRDRKESKHHRGRQGMIKPKVGMPWCTGTTEPKSQPISVSRHIYLFVVLRRVQQPAGSYCDG